MSTGFNYNTPNPELGMNLSQEDQALLRKRNFSLRPLSTVGHLDLGKVFSLSMHATVIFLFCLIMCNLPWRFTSPTVIAVIYWIGLVILLLMPTLALVLLVIGIVSTLISSRVRTSAMLYWGWWPFWTCVMCYIAAIVGTDIGNTLWSDYYYPYSNMSRLQTYSYIDASSTPSQRIPDAGIVTFASNTVVNRTDSGCVKEGSTYCVAPIYSTSKVESNTTYDLFMAGTDCCTCPNSVFKCGTWDGVGYVGGMRITDEDEIAGYLMAMEQWMVSNGKDPVDSPIFFTWANQPDVEWADLRSTGNADAAIALIFAVLISMISVMLLNGVLKVILEREWAAPIDTPMPPPGIGQKLAATVLPQMSRHAARQQQDAPSFVIL